MKLGSIILLIIACVFFFLGVTVTGGSLVCELPFVLAGVAFLIIAFKWRT